MTTSPSTRRLTLALVMLLSLGLLATLAPAPAGASRARLDLDFCSERGAISAARLPARVSARSCDLVGRRIVSGSLALEVPARGHGVSAAAIGTTGESELTILTESDGDVLVTEGSSESNDLSSLATTPAPAPCDEQAFVGCADPCTDNNFNLNPAQAKVKQKQPWFFKASTTPAGFTVAQALAEIKAGTKNVVNTTNDCALSDVVTKSAPYKGTTNKGTGITVSGGGANVCGNTNGKNSVDFGPLATTTLGLACSTYTSTTGPTGPWFITEADIRLKKTTPWTLLPDDPGCSGLYDMRGVMTHERGHTFGLSHTDAVIAHTPQTMFPAGYPCNSYARTLGKGDRAGLNALY